MLNIRCLNYTVQFGEIYLIRWNLLDLADIVCDWGQNIYHGLKFLMFCLIAIAPEHRCPGLN